MKHRKTISLFPCKWIYHSHVKFWVIIRFLFNLLDNNNIYRIIERKKNHKIHNIYHGKPSWGRKPKKKFLNIDSQYNDKTINQTLENIQHWAMMCLSLFLLPATGNCNFLQTCALDEWAKWVCKWVVGFLYLYKMEGVGKVSLHWAWSNFLLSG